MDSSGLLPSTVEVSASDRLRVPLATQVNSPQSSSFQRQLRHKPAFIHRIDSSEESPSSHDSIFEAEYWSNVNSEDSSHKNEGWQALALNAANGISSNANSDENQEVIQVPSIRRTSIFYGSGTPLPTIIEQKSNTTMHTAASTLSRSLSASDLASLNAKSSYTLLQAPSFELSPNVPFRFPRRRKSFSANDLELLKLSPPKAIMHSPNASDILEIYAQPRQPVIPPISRSPTPPGMPSWTAAQHPHLRITPPQQGGWPIRAAANRVQRFFGIQSSRLAFSSRIPSPVCAEGQNLPPGQRLFQGTTAVPRFRPPTGGHGQPLELHPFVRVGPGVCKTADQQSPGQVAERIQPLSSMQTLRPTRRAKRTRRKNNGRHRARNLDVNRPYEMSPTNRSLASVDTHTGCSRHQTPYASLRNSPIGFEPGALRAQYTVLTSAIGPPSESSPNLSFDISLPSTPATATISMCSPSSEESRRCWKCRIKCVFAKINGLRERSANWYIWMCCGVDINDDRISIIETGDSRWCRTATG